MEHARRAGFPVPEVRDVSGPDMVVARVRGRTMTEDLVRWPWRVDSHARTLGALHRQLHAIAAPPGLRAPLGDGDALLHLDLHPQNVLLGPGGPWVIDWANAARGPGAAEVALTFVIVGAVPRERSPLERIGGVLRRRFAIVFLTAADDGTVRGVLPRAVEFRLADGNLTAAERDAVEALRARMLRS